MAVSISIHLDETVEVERATTGKAWTEIRLPGKVTVVFFGNYPGSGRVIDQLITQLRALRALDRTPRDMASEHEANEHEGAFEPDCPECENDVTRTGEFYDRQAVQS